MLLAVHLCHATSSIYYLQEFQVRLLALNVVCKSTKSNQSQGNAMLRRVLKSQSRGMSFVTVNRTMSFVKCNWTHPIHHRTRGPASTRLCVCRPNHRFVLKTLSNDCRVPVRVVPLSLPKHPSVVLSHPEGAPGARSRPRHGRKRGAATGRFYRRTLLFDAHHY